MIKRVDRYIGRSVIEGILAAWGILLTLVMVLGFVSELRSGRGDYGVLQALWFVVLTVPRLAYQVFPIAALVGALIGAGGLAASFELTAFRAAGISRLRIAVAALLGSVLVLIPVMWVGEYLAPEAEQQARAFRLDRQAGRIHLGGAGGLWVRDGQNIVNIRQPLMTADGAQQEVRFQDVSIYRIGDDHSLAGITRAGEAVPSGGQWLLRPVEETIIEEQSVQKSGAEDGVWETEVDPGLLDSAITRPRYLSMRALSSYIGYLTDNGQDAGQYQTALWEKIVYPLSVLALILAGMPFVFGSNRQLGLGVRLFTGMALGAVYIIVARSSQNFGEAYGLPVWISALLPLVLLTVFAYWALRRTP